MTPRRAERKDLTVAIRGEGIAAACSAHLLARAGFGTARTTRGRVRVPALLLSDAALALMRDVFERPHLFDDRPRVTHRVVAWGTGEPTRLPHGGVVLSEGDLEAALGGGAPGATDQPFMTVHTAPPFPIGAVRSFGSRRTVSAQVRLLHEEDRSACWIEAVEDGWLFVVPSGPASGWLLAVGASADTLLAQSRHIAPRIEQVGQPSAAFETSPRILTALQGPDWLACGSAAIGFDPICGDGTAQAVREAILASALIDAIQAGGSDPEDLRRHFESMMIAAMRRHLRLCAQFYASGGEGAWWRTQLADLAEGFDWCTARLAKTPEPRFVLQDFRLVAREAAA